MDILSDDGDSDDSNDWRRQVKKSASDEVSPSDSASCSSSAPNSRPQSSIPGRLLQAASFNKTAKNFFSGLSRNGEKSRPHTGSSVSAGSRSNAGIGSGSGWNGDIQNSRPATAASSVSGVGSVGSGTNRGSLKTKRDDLSFKPTNTGSQNSGISNTGFPQQNGNFPPAFSPEKRSNQPSPNSNFKSRNAEMNSAFKNNERPLVLANYNNRDLTFSTRNNVPASASKALLPGGGKRIPPPTSSKCTSLSFPGR